MAEKRDLLTIYDLTGPEILELLELSQRLKEGWKRGERPKLLKDMTLGLIFHKPSTRTRVSFEVAMYQLGGATTFMDAAETQLSRGESPFDAGQVLSRYLDCLVVRTYSQSIVEDMARGAEIPVINGLTDLCHPCQVLSDLLTIKEKLGSLDDLVVAWVGDGNNMAHSWINAAARLGFKLKLACPRGYEPLESVVKKGMDERARVEVVDDPYYAVEGAAVINTDVWASMGQEGEKDERKAAFRPYQVNRELLEAAEPGAIVMHCLPAHRGEEITDEVLDGPSSVVLLQAENRLHLQKGLLYKFLAE